ncbi:MAG: hypothetical protein H6Q29_1404 [Bacteroidetes bacterium]|nr:hypothetical protein [Bacteroidota bacterium]
MRIRLIDIAHARSGDKGDTGNVGVIARRREYYPILVKYLTPDRVKAHFSGIALGPVERFELPNLWALNFLLHNALGGGGTISLKHDAQGKTLSSAMLRMELDIEEQVVVEGTGDV